MGEEPKQEQAKEEDKKEEKAEEPKQQSSPLLLFVDLHCVGCAKKIEKSIMKIRGVEGVVIDMAQNQVSIKGEVEAEAVCTKITRRTKRKARVLTPLPVVDAQSLPQLDNSQASELTTVELNVNMHCEACAEQLKRKILKMKGVRSATTELSSGKVTVTGTMDANGLVDYVYRHAKKQAKIIPQPEPEKPPEAEEPPKPEEKKEEEKPADQESKPEEKKEEGDQGTDKKDTGGESKDQEEPKKEGEEQNVVIDEQAMQRMMYCYQPPYVIERIPPPQLFSDENPNSCCIT
ncbi:hypothetical protein U1Q18_004899 [Sarracenia purpurea var. burkii]